MRYSDYLELKAERINSYSVLIKKYILSCFLLGLLMLPLGLIAQNPLNKIFKTGGKEISIDTTNANFESKSSFDEVNIKNINKLIQNTASLVLSDKELINKENWRQIDSIFSEKEKFIEQEEKEFNAYDKPNLSKFFLQNLRLSWENYVTEIEKWQNNLASHLDKTIKESKLFIERRKLLKRYNELIKKEHLPVLSKQITNTIKELDSIIDSFNNDKQQLLVLQTRISDKNILCHKVIEDLEKLNSQLRIQVFEKTKPVIWKITLKNTIHDGFISSFKRAYRNNYKSISYYYSNLSNRKISYLFLMGFLILFILFIRKRYIALGYDSNMPGFVKIERVLIKNPGEIIFSLALALWIFFFPYIPTLLSDFFFIVITFSLSLILRKFIDKTGRKLLVTLLILLILNVLEVVIWYLGDYSRLYLLFETGIALLLLLPFLSIYKERDLSGKSKFSKMAKKFLPFMLITYSAAFIGNIFGFENFSVLFIKIGIRTAVITMIAYGYVRILVNIYFATTTLLNLRYPDIAFKYGEVIDKRGSKVIHIIIFFLWAKAILRIFEIDTPFSNWMSGVLTSDITIGTIAFSLSDILLFGIILYITYLISVFVKTIIEGEILVKMKLPRGFPAAISMMVRIFLVTLGIMFALSATGIELSKLSLLAGALGVGIGFGLQNIVQNFISGLILIFERPIQVGDTVEVNNLLGKVKDIGVRASNVITYDGAEVVVPNSNLISNDLINWTLSDSRKRMEVKVGVAYGSDPNIVLKLIERVALDHPNVEQNPPPRALFEGFGDSSLDFRLLFWVNFESGLSTKSDIAVGIYNTFAEHNIEIPFPQVDLHVKDISGNRSEIKNEQLPNSLD